MAFEAAKEYLEKRGFGDRVQQFETSSATVELAAQAVGCQPARIAKTLSFLTGDQGILIVTAGDARIDNRKYRERFGTKARMMSPEQVLRLVGHPVGGVCPFGIQPGIRVYLDASLRRFDTVYPACGSANSAVRLAPEELLEAVSEAEWVDVCRGWGEESGGAPCFSAQST